MKILINISVITQNSRGMAVFTKQIVKELVKKKNFDYIFVAGNELDQEILELILDSKHTFKQINVPLPIFDQIIIPYLIKKYKPDVCWFPSNTFPLIMSKGTNYIVTIHDIIFLMNEFKLPTIYQRIARFYRVVIIKMGLKKIHKITSVSKTTLRDLYKRFNISKKTDERDILYNSLITVKNEDDLIFKKLKMNSTDKYIYSIAGNGKHKNLEFFIDSFNRFNLIKPNYKLVVSGAFKSELYRRKYENIIFTPFISDQEKISLIKNADLFVFPSLVEGFGIPVIEGLFYNPRVLVSDIPIFREIAKDYVTYFDPYDKDFIKKYFIEKKSLLNDHQEAKSYILKTFNLSKSTEKLEKIFFEFKQK